MEPFEVRIEKLHDNEVALEIWQQPFNSTPPVKVARIQGTALHVAWDYLISFLRRAGIQTNLLSPSRQQRSLALAEDIAVRVELALFGE